jgi:cell division protein FtsQ
VVSVILNNRRAYSFDLENGVRVVLGRYAFDERLDRFLKFVPTLIPDRINDIDSIDLRYSNGLSVFWKNKFNISSN